MKTQHGNNDGGGHYDDDDDDFIRTHAYGQLLCTIDDKVTTRKIMEEIRTIHETRVKIIVSRPLF